MSDDYVAGDIVVTISPLGLSRSHVLLLLALEIRHRGLRGSTTPSVSAAGTYLCTKTLVR
jgi:hypothetical protein